MSQFGRKNYTLEAATSRMERYCAYQERCHSEVVQKLQSMRMIPEAIDSIVVHLIEHNYLNEERFTQAFVRGKFRQKQWGRIRLRSELKQKRISPYLIRKTLESIPESEYLSVFEALFKKRLKNLEGEPPARLKQKLHSYLYYRGWENELIYDRIRQLGL